MDRGIVQSRKKEVEEKKKGNLDLAGIQIGDVFKVIEKIKIEDVDEFLNYVGTQEAVSPLFNPTLYMRANLGDKFQIAKERALIIRKVLQDKNKYYV